MFWYIDQMAVIITYLKCSYFFGHFEWEEEGKAFGFVIDPAYRIEPQGQNVTLILSGGLLEGLS